MRAIHALAFVLLFTAIPTVAQPPTNRNCRDDRGTDRCAEAQQQRMRELYGVRSIEEHRAAGDQVWRVFYVDGYGGDLILIAFVRAPRRDPTLWVHYPRREGEPRPEPLQVPVTQASWDEVVERSVSFDRSFAQRPGETGLCLHSWVYTIESVGRSRGRLPAEVRRKTEDACENGPGSAYARELERIALSLIPHCAALDRRQHRNPSSMLAACRILHGDRLAAAEVLNRASGFRSIGGPEDRHRLIGLFAHETRIDWNGEEYRGSWSGAADFWVAHLDQQSGAANFYFQSVEAESADRVRLTGMLSRSVDGPQGRGNSSQQARVGQIWVRDFNGHFSIATATVGPWES